MISGEAFLFKSSCLMVSLVATSSASIRTSTRRTLLALAALTCKTQKVTFTRQVANFISGAEVEGGNIHYNGRTIHFDKYVVGIDCQRFADTIEEPEVQTRIQELEAQYKDKTIIIGVDRMDYTKGLPEKMEGFRVFLDEHPEMSEKVVLIQIAIPSREDVKKYQDLEAEVSKLVGQITGKYGKWLRKSIRLHTRKFWDWYLAKLWISC